MLDSYCLLRPEKGFQRAKAETRARFWWGNYLGLSWLLLRVKISYNMAAACQVAPSALAEVCVGLRTASQRQLYTVVTVMWSRVEACLGIRKPEQGPPCLTNNIPNVLQQARDPTKQMICIRHCPKYITTEPAIYKQGTSTCIRPKIQFLTVPSPVGIEECCLFEIKANLTNVCFVLR